MSTKIRELIMENCNDANLRKEIRSQVCICRDLCRPLTEEQILALCAMETVAQIQRFTHNVKFA